MEPGGNGALAHPEHPGDLPGGVPLVVEEIYDRPVRGLQLPDGLGHRLHPGREDGHGLGLVQGDGGPAAQPPP